VTTKYIRLGFWPRHGLAVVRFAGRFFSLKAPWCAALFSERMGFHRVFPLGFGWRVTVRRVGE